jgi:hypothetical protein
LAQIINHVKGITWLYFIEKPMKTQAHKKQTHDDIKEIFLVEEGKSFHLIEK